MKINIDSVIKKSEPIENYDKQAEIDEAQALMMDEYRELVKLITYPPFILKKNLSRFEDDMTIALKQLQNKKNYDPSLFGGIERRWQKELRIARKLSNNGKTTISQAIKKYMDTNKDVTLFDFVQRYVD